MRKKAEPSKVDSVPENNSEVAFMLVRLIAEETLLSLGIKELPEVAESLGDQLWETYFHRFGNDIIITIQLYTRFTSSTVQFSLLDIVYEILLETKQFVADEKVQQVLVLDPSRLERFTKEVVLALVQEYLLYLPMVVFHSFFEGLIETLMGATKKLGEPALKRHLDKLGIERDVKFFPKNEIRDLTRKFPDVPFHLLRYVDRENRNIRKKRDDSYRDRKVWLSSDARKELPKNYDRIRQRYWDAKREYKAMLAEFEKQIRRPPREEFEMTWRTFCLKNYLDLIFADQVRDLPPSQLAYMQLGDFYGESQSYMEKLVGIIRHQTRKS